MKLGLGNIVNLNTFDDIYEVKKINDKLPVEETRLHFATVQSIVKRLYYDEKSSLPIDTYDCIIVDKVHRGYLLDKEMDAA